MKKEARTDKKAQESMRGRIISALLIIAIGFILLNLAFILAAVYQGLLQMLIGLFIQLGPESEIYWLPPLMHLSFFVLLLLLSYFIFNSRLKTLYKSIFSVVPLAAVYVTLGIFLYQWTTIAIAIGALFFLSVLYYLYKTKKPWQYYFSLVYISILMLIVVLLGIDI